MIGGFQPKMIAVGAVCASTVYAVTQVPMLPAKLIASKAVRVVDGMAVSAACAFRKLGGQAAIWTRTGDDAEGRHIRASLQEEGLDVAGVRMIPGAASSHCCVVVDAKGERLVIPYHDAAVDPSPDWLPLGDLSSVDFLHCDVRWPEGAEAALRAAAAIGLPAMLDGEVAPVATLRRLAPLARYAVFSDDGLYTYTGESSIEPALRKAAALNAGHVGASCGKQGYYWLEEGALRHCPAPVVDVVDTLAAGDVFHGALALALAEARPMAAAVRFAVVAASLKCRTFGGRLGCPTRDEVEAAGG